MAKGVLPFRDLVLPNRNGRPTIKPKEPFFTRVPTERTKRNPALFTLKK
jgi:hypothetical protein